jgi:hypothetical protein
MNSLSSTDILSMRIYRDLANEKDWDDLVKMYMAAYDKIPDVHWATYQVP